MNIVKKIKSYLRLYYAIAKADKCHSEDGERYYVIPNGKNKLLVTDRKNFRILKQKGYISRKANIIALEKECFYHTPYKDGSGSLSAEYMDYKKRMYYKYVELYN